MKKWLAIICVISLLLVSACGSSNANDTGELPDEDWEAISSKAEGTKVNMFMWGGDDGNVSERGIGGKNNEEEGNRQDFAIHCNITVPHVAEPPFLSSKAL